MAADSDKTGTTHDRAPQQSLALYRKYRPATFAELRGQDHVTEPLRQALRSGRINHAYLFSGPRGCGKTSSARILARSLNCVNGPTPDPCGICDSCVALASSGPGSIDVIEIDAASHGGVDDARDLRERAFYAPVAGRYKIYIIDEAHMVTQQGFNALLKLVEEPPAHLKFIFATTEPDKVIATIRSRTHHYPFRLMAPSVMRDLTEEILKSEHVPFEPAVLPLVVRAGAGSARDTLSILDQLLAGSDEGGIRYDRAVALLGYTDASLLDETVEAFADRDGAAVFRAVNRVIEGGHEPRRFATDLLDRFRDLIVLASVPDAIGSGLLDVPPDRAGALAGQAEGFGLASLTRAADIVATSLDQMRGATSPRLLLELMCAQVLLPGATSDERSLLARLERLEAGAPVAPPARAAGGNGDPYSERVRPIAPPAPSPASGPASGPSASSPEPAQAAPETPSAAPQAPPAPETPPAAPQAPPAPPRAADPFTHAPGAPGAPVPVPAAAPSGGAPRGGEVNVDVLRQAWPNIVESVKANGRVAALMVGNASVADFQEGVLILRFPRQGEVRGFTGSKYEDLLKQALTRMFGINVVIRAISGGDPPPAASGRRPAPEPPAPSGPAQSSPQPGAPMSAPRPGDYPPPSPSPAGPAAQSSGPASAAVASSSVMTAPPGGSAGNGANGNQHPFGGTSVPGGDLPPLPAPPPPEDEDFDPDEEDMRSSTPVNELTGMALVQRELGAQVIAEYDD